MLVHRPLAPSAVRQPQVYKFSSDSRLQLLCALMRAVERQAPRAFAAFKITRAGVRRECLLSVFGADIIVRDHDGKIQSQYPLDELHRVQLATDDPSCVALWAHGKPRVYALPDRAAFIKVLGSSLDKVGLMHIVSERGTTVTECRTFRAHMANDGGTKLADLDVLKRSPKYHIPHARRLVVTSAGLAERDAQSYAPVTWRPLADVFAVVRHWDEPQLLTIEFTDGSSRAYVSPRRDYLLAALVDACRLSGNTWAGIIPTCTGSAARLSARSHVAQAEQEDEVRSLVLRHLERTVKSAHVRSGAPFSAEVVRATDELCANVPHSGLAWDTKRGALSSVVPDLTAHALAAMQVPDTPSAVVITMLAALHRLISPLAGYKLFIQAPAAPELVVMGLQHSDAGVAAACAELLLRVLCNTCAPSREARQKDLIDLEAAAKRSFLSEPVRVALIHLLDMHARGASGAAASSTEGTLLALSVVQCLDSALIGEVDTTPVDARQHLMQLVASRYQALLALLRSEVPSIVECSAMLMRAIVRQADAGTVRAMQAASLSTGVLLRHLFQSVFAPAFDTRYVSRYLVELWSTGNPTAHDLYRRAMPPGLLVYLDMPPLTSSERDNLEALERADVDEDAARIAAAGVSGSSAEGGIRRARGLASRLRTRLDAADAAEKSTAMRRLEALAADAPGAKRLGGLMRDNAAEAARRAAHAAAAEASVAAAAAMTKAKLESDGKAENYAVFFHMLMQDHNLPDLIWNSQTRAELRSALEAELREIEAEIELGGATATGAKGDISNAGAGDDGAGSSAVDEDSTRSRLDGDTPAFSDASDDESPGGDRLDVSVSLHYAWNHAEFSVVYPSLAQELRVGELYLRIFLDSGDSSVKGLRHPVQFFDALYRRALRESAPNLKSLCLRGMARTYALHWQVIGAFEDTDYIVWMLATSMNAGVRDHLLLLLQALARHPVNCEKMVNPDALQLMVDLLTTAHTQDIERRVTALSTVGGGLMLRDATAAEKGSLSPGHAAASRSDADADGSPAGSAEKPSDMKIWHYRADKAHVPAGEKPERGPLSLEDLRQIGRMGQLSNVTLVWARGMRQWVRLDSLRAVYWYVMSEGEPKLTPSERGEAAGELLLRLATLRPSVDAEGNPVRPVPRVKRVLSSARCLPHIAQALLAGSDKLVDTVAQLIMCLVEHNPKAMVKLYLTGMFYFVLVYPGSNWGTLSELLKATHLKQSFYHEASTLARESTLAKRSVLGTMLPESLLCVLADKPAPDFPRTFLFNVDTPAVIWKYSMRAHLLDMITQHLGDLPARLAANPCTLYDYCPIPRVVYEDLEQELWCANFYLANLTDEARFPDWPIKDPVGLLRAVLDAWRTEAAKEGADAGTVSTDEACDILGVPADADDKAIRKAYRKLAMKYHPDKNPAGRETFEKISAAYELLTTARPEAASGPDPVAILLMIRTQSILFKRFSKDLAPYKYAGYPLLLAPGTLLPEPGAGICVEGTAERVEAAAHLAYLTCLAASRNADELLDEGGLDQMLQLLRRTRLEVAPPTERHEGATPQGATPAAGAAAREAAKPLAQRYGLLIMEHVLHTLSGMVTMPDARAVLVKLIPAAGEDDLIGAGAAAWAQDIVYCLRYTQSASVLQYALETVVRASVDSQLQNALVTAGVVWFILPLLFRYDLTLEKAEGSQLEQSPAAGDQHANSQAAANRMAKLAVRALGRLGGYLSDKLATPRNDRVQRIMRSLLTAPLARRLGRMNAVALLDTLNGSEETPQVVWTPPMRKELREYVAARQESALTTGDAAADAAFEFRFSALANELCLTGVYVRFFVADPGMTLDNPYHFTAALLRHIAYSPAGPGPCARTGERLQAEGSASQPLLRPDDAEIAENTRSLTTVQAQKQLRMALRALHLIVINAPGVEDEIAKGSAACVPSIFAMLQSFTHDADAIDDTEMFSSAAHDGGAAGGVGGIAAPRGQSAGAGGARSTGAAFDAPLRELALTAIAAFLPHEGCARMLADFGLVPFLIQLLPRDAAGAGAALRNLMAHTCVVEELAATGHLIDLMLVFAGGPLAETDLAAGKPAAVQVAHEARQQAGALLSLLCSDATHGPGLVMALGQLLPESLAATVKESVSAATNTGGARMGAAGSGAGAAGAGGGAGSLGDALLVFDGDHENPELIWDVSCRNELRVTLTQIHKNLAALRKKRGASTSTHPNRVRWTLPATFRMQYSLTEGELQVGGVWIRVFLKEPTFALRDPKAFLEACCRRLATEGEQLLGLTSDDADARRRAEAAAAEEAARAGGKSAAAAAGDLVVRGDDVSTHVTHAIVCLLRVREQLADHVAALGYVPKFTSMLSKCPGKPARFALGMQCVRVLEVLSKSRGCVGAMGRAGTVRTIVRTLQPLHRDAAFVVEALKSMLEFKGPEVHDMVDQAIRAGLIDILVEGLTGDVSHLVDPSAFKVHAVAVLKLLEANSVHGPAATLALNKHGRVWDKFRHQKHDLFLSRNDTRDYFLADVQNAPSLLLKNTAAGGAGATAPPPGAGGAAAAAAARSATDTPNRNVPPPMLTDETAPPPMPGMDDHSDYGSGAFGGFQAPAPAPSAFGGFQAPAPAPVPAPAPAPVPARAPAPAPAPARAPAPAPASGSDPFSGLSGLGAAPAPAPAAGGNMFMPAPAPAPAPSGRGADPFADLLGQSSAPTPAPAPAPAAANGDDLFANMTTAAPAPAPASGADPFAHLLD